MPVIDADRFIDPQDAATAPPFSDRLAMQSAAPYPTQRLLIVSLLLLFVLMVLLAIAVWMMTAAPSGSAIGRFQPVRQAHTDGTSQALDAYGIPLPPVEPVRYLDVPRQRAFEINEAVPFSNDPVVPAKPFRDVLTSDDLARATDCLAAAGYYEAGDDVIGQQAVDQVVINRVRHPAFPATICGVVFQGSDRATGCQFSFTCDGSIDRRHPSDAAWQRAKGVALAALGGYVARSVGLATHYHTDWVVPNWSSNVDKIARVGTQLFYRWHGAAGEPRVFREAHGSPEPEVPQLAFLATGDDTADVAATDAPATDADSAASTGQATGGAGDGAAAKSIDVPGALLRGNRLLSASANDNRFVLQTGPAGVTNAMALVALDLCRLQPRAACTVVSYAGPAPAGQPDFYYLHDSARGVERVYWDCQKLHRDKPDECMPAGFTP